MCAFKIDSPTIKGKTETNYRIKNDGTAVDNLVRKLLSKIDFSIESVNVGGLTGTPSKKDHRCFHEMKKKKPLKSGSIKTYFVRISLSYDCMDPWSLNELFPSDLWAHGFDHKKAIELSKEAAKRISETFSDVLERDVVRAGIFYSRGNSQYLSFGVELPVSAYDALVHCPTNLTDFATKNIKEVSKILDEYLRRKNLSLSVLYHDRRKLDRLCRKAENEFRTTGGLPMVSEGWINQALLYRSINVHFRYAKKEYSPRWLLSQRIDIYIPEKKVAIEYHGQQHYEPVELFGGEQGFVATVERDKRKAELCEENGVRYYEWPYTRPVTDQEVSKLLAELSNMT
jgi:hypothetical protein